MKCQIPVYLLTKRETPTSRLPLDQEEKPISRLSLDQEEKGQLSRLPLGQGETPISILSLVGVTQAFLVGDCFHREGEGEREREREREGEREREKEREREREERAVCLSVCLSVSKPARLNRDWTQKDHLTARTQPTRPQLASVGRPAPRPRAVRSHATGEWCVSKPPWRWETILPTSPLADTRRRFCDLRPCARDHQQARTHSRFSSRRPWRWIGLGQMPTHVTEAAPKWLRRLTKG